jgi:hypothetical protein
MDGWMDGLLIGWMEGWRDLRKEHYFLLTLAQNDILFFLFSLY